MLAQLTKQGVDVWHARPGRRRSSRRRSCAGCATWSATGRGLRAAAPRAASWPTSWRWPWPAMCISRRLLRRSVGRRAAAVLEGARVYASDQTHFSVAPRARRARVPGGDARRRRRSDERFRLRGAAGRRGHRRDRAAGLTPDRDRRGRGLDEHRLGGPRRRARRRRRRARACGCTSTRRTAGRPGYRRATRPACPDLELADSVTRRSAQVVLPGLRHRRPDGPRRRRTCAQTFRRGPSTTAVAARPAASDDARRRRPLDFYELGSRAPAAGGR